MTDSSRPIRIKVIRKSTKASPDKTESLLWGDCLFCIMPFATFTRRR